MEPGEWRYGQSGRPWSAEPAEETPPPDLWGDEATSGSWSGAAAWTPPAWSQTGTHPTAAPARHAASLPEPEPDRPGTAWIGATGPTPGLPEPALPRWDDPRWGEQQSAAGAPPSWSDQPAAAVPATRPRHSSALVPVVTEPRRRAEAPRDQPALGPVLGYTGGWYAIPSVLFLIWLLFLDGEHRSAAWRGAVSGLGWLFAAVLASLAVVLALRTFVTGWRALTMSFAATVIGAGLITILHSAV